MTAGWTFSIDRGGTFTDIVARAPDGRLIVRKLLSDNPGRYEDAAVAGIGQILAEAWRRRDRRGEDGDDGRHQRPARAQGRAGRAGDHAGFGDALRIGYQARPDIFARQIVLPEPLYGHVVEIDERVTADGRGAAPARCARRRAPGFRRRSTRAIARSPSC